MIDLLILLAFVAYALYAGFRASGAASQDLQQYFLAGRTIKGWRAGVSMAATQFAADTPLLVMGLIATGGIFLLWQLWIYGLSFLAIGFIFSAKWRRAQVLTDAELTEIRYSGRGVTALRAFKALYYGTVINCVVLAFVLTAALRIAEVFLPWHLWLPGGLYNWIETLLSAAGLSLMSAATDLPDSVATANNVISLVLLLAFTAGYSTAGGLRGVVATDVAQFFLALGGTALYAWLAVGEAGGLGGLPERVIELYGPGKGAEMLHVLPPLETVWMSFVVIIALQWVFQMYSDGTGYLAQRAMGCRSNKDARVAAVTFTWLQVVLRSVIWVLIGVALLVVYPFDPAQVGADGFKAAREVTFVTGIDELLPVGVRGLMLTGMLAALASTVDTHLNWGASYWSNDIYKNLINTHWLGREPKAREQVLVARLANILILVLALIVMSQLGSIQQGWKLSLMLGAGVGAVLVLRWIWERINLWSEVAAIVASIVMGTILLLAMPEPEAEWLRLSLMALVSTAAAVGITFITPPTDAAVREVFYRRVRPVGFWRRTAIEIGDDPAKAPRRLAASLLAVAVTGLSVFLTLVGLTRLLIPVPGASPVLPWGFLAAGAALVPIWWRHLMAGPAGTPEADEEAEPHLRPPGVARTSAEPAASPSSDDPS